MKILWVKFRQSGLRFVGRANSKKSIPLGTIAAIYFLKNLTIFLFIAAKFKFYSDLLLYSCFLDLATFWCAIGNLSKMDKITSFCLFNENKWWKYSKQHWSNFWEIININNFPNSIFFHSFQLSFYGWVFY